jgi:hypothetical protein
MFSLSKRRPGCVIIQALGGTVPREQFNKLFPGETWLTAMGDDMRLYRVTDEELGALSKMARKAVEKKHGENRGSATKDKAGGLQKRVRVDDRVRPERREEAGGERHKRRA